MKATPIPAKEASEVPRITVRQERENRSQGPVQANTGGKQVNCDLCAQLGCG